jgi:hypothetical protein
MVLLIDGVEIVTTKAFMLSIPFSVAIKVTI